MSKLTILICVSLLILVFSVDFGNAQNVGFIPNAGICKTFGDKGDLWNLGFSVGANLFYPTQKILSFGVRMAYHSMTPNGEEIMKLGAQPSLDYKIESTSGSFSIYEIVPSLQIATSSFYDDPTVRLAFQLGGGIFVLNQSEISARGVHYSPYGGSLTSTVSLNDVTETKPGVQFGIELSIKRKLAILPLYSMVFTDEQSTSFVSVCLGYIFGR